MTFIFCLYKYFFAIFSLLASLCNPHAIQQLAWAKSLPIHINPNRTVKQAILDNPWLNLPRWLGFHFPFERTWSKTLANPNPFRPREQRKPILITVDWSGVGVAFIWIAGAACDVGHDALLDLVRRWWCSRDVIWEVMMSLRRLDAGPNDAVPLFRTLMPALYRFLFIHVFIDSYIYSFIYWFIDSFIHPVLWVIWNIRQ